MIGPITKMIPTWNTRSASSRAVEIWDAKRSCSSSSLTTPSPFGVGGPLGGELVLQLLPGGDPDGPLVLLGALGEVVDVLLEVLAQLRPLLGQVVVLARGQRRDEQDHEHGERRPPRGRTGRCRAPAGCGGAWSRVTTGLSRNTMAPARISGGQMTRNT